MPSRTLFAAALTLSLLFIACDFNKTSSQIQARTTMVATLFHTPAVEIRPEAIAGFDAGFFDNDGGFTFDGGFPFDGGFTFDGGGFFSDGGLIVPAQTLAFAFFGTRNGEGIDQLAPTPIAGATLTVGVHHDAGHPMKDLGSGTYSLDSNSDSAFVYAEGAAFAFTALAKGETFAAVVTDVPRPEEIPQFHPDGKSYIDQVANTEFAFRRPDPDNGKERNLGFVIVFPISRDGSQGPPTFTNLPKEPLDYLKLVLVPNQWRTTEVRIPGTAFPEKDHNYVILMQSAKLGGPDSDNLFAGSAILAGTANVGIVKTRP